MPVALANTNLFKPIKVGNVTLQNRLVHSPLTRFRNDPDGVATNSILEYYKERAENNGGLIIFEGTMPSEEFGVHSGLPYVNTSRQVEAWAKVVEAVHDAGSFADLQLWSMRRGTEWLVVDPSSEVQKKAGKEAEHFVSNPTKLQIQWAVEQYASAARKAIEVAKFDLIEFIADGGAVPAQFFRRALNDRTDEYGGSVENRARFTLEVVDALIEAVGADKVGIKISPFNVDEGEQTPPSDFEYLLEEFEKRAEKGHRLAYVVFTEPRVYGGYDQGTAEVNKEDNVELTKWVGESWKGTLFRTGALLHDEEYKNLQTYVNGDDRTLIEAGRYFTSNPDLPERLKQGYALTPYERATFYTVGSNKGYLGWGRYGEDRREVAEGVRALI